MFSRRSSLWLGGFVVTCPWVVDVLDGMGRRTWRILALPGSAAGYVWLGIATVCAGVMAVAALAVQLTYFRGRTRERNWSRLVFILAPHLLVCGLLVATSVVLEDAEVAQRLMALGASSVSGTLRGICGIWLAGALFFSLLDGSTRLQSETTGDGRGSGRAVPPKSSDG